MTIQGQKEWDECFSGSLRYGARNHWRPIPVVLRFVSLAQEKGGRVWFPGCGLDSYPKTYAERGLDVLATDFSTVAVRYQEGLAAAFLENDSSTRAPGRFVVRHHDFTQGPPGGEFDVVINNLAFQSLPPDDMRPAAESFFAALRPGGAAIIDIIDIVGHRQDQIEESLEAAGFYLPFPSERWFRCVLETAGISPNWRGDRPLVGDIPHIPKFHRYPAAIHQERLKRDQVILDTLQLEFERRRQEEEKEVMALISDGTTRVAYVTIHPQDKFARPPFTRVFNTVY